MRDLRPPRHDHPTDRGRPTAGHPDGPDDPTDDDTADPVADLPDDDPLAVRPTRRRRPVEDPGEAVPWSSWDVATRGPTPRPAWVVTDPNALDTDLGVLKTGKEADVHLLQRALPGTVGVTMAAKRYRTAEHRQFHRDAGYQEGRRVRRSRETRAMARRTDFGRELLAGQWAAAEFAALGRLWEAGAPVPYPVQLLGTELLLEFLGDEDGRAAPRLAQWRGDATSARDLWRQCRAAMELLAAHGWAHGDLSPYNLLVHDGRLVLIDLPQVVDVIANPRGMDFLQRDCRTVTAWFARHGVDPADCDGDLLFGDLAALAAGR